MSKVLDSPSDDGCPDVPSDTNAPQRPQRERRPTPRALDNSVQTAERELDRQWRTTRQVLTLLNAEPDEEDKIRTAVTDAQNAIRVYSEVWIELENHYARDQAYNKDAILTKTTYLENINHANTIIALARERAYTLALETRSDGSKQSRASSVYSFRSSRSSKSSSASSRSARAEALASAAAATKNVAFEEMIAKRTSEMVAQKALSELERARREAEIKVEETKRQWDQHMKEAAAEADLQILRARQTAAVENARTDAILQVEQEERMGVSLTSPDQSSNDHALQFHASTETHPAVTSQLRLSAPVFQPIGEQPSPFQNPADATEFPPLLKPPEIQKTGAENTILDMTKEITDMLARQRQPAHEPDVYGGNPIMFRPWRSSFETMVNQARTPGTQKLAFLAKYTKGEVKQLVDRFRHRHVSDPETAYQEAWKELEERFGNKTKITTDILQRLTSFPKVKTDENHKLLELADLCADTAAQIDDLPGLNILNYSHNLHPILDKLPTHIHNAWRKRASEYKMTYDAYPPFTILAKFLKDKARLHNDPELYPSSQILHPTPEKTRTNRNHGSTLRVMATSTPMKTASTHRVDDRCLYHDTQGHHVSECIVFSRKPIQERREFCKTKGLCFKCGRNHRIKDCDIKVQCKKCKDTGHASFMHVPPRQYGGENPVEKSAAAHDHKATDAIAKCTRFLACSSARSCSKIVLCKVYHKDRPSESILGYAVLDDQSNACLGGPEVFDSLKLPGPTFPYELSTCGGERITVEGRRASGLIVESASTGKAEQLPTIIENAHIPGDRTEIPSPDLCMQFPHLRTLSSKIPEPRDDVDIILLIGRNCPELLKIRESINGKRGTPWAQRTDLGWTISGQVCMSGVEGKVHASVNRTILQPQADGDPRDALLTDVCRNHIYVKEVLSSCHQNDTARQDTDIYRETTEDNVKAMSVEDKRFIHIMTQGAHTNREGNLEFPLPFKKGNISLPDNYPYAQSRLNSLLKTLRRKPKMMEDYLAFFEKILTRDHASPVPKNELITPRGMVWYLPHFAVHHPKKRDIRVVFDASAEFAGTSLNKTLLQGPDQMNSLLGILFRFRLGEVAVMGDIEQMFHNFYVNPEHRDFLRFLWFENNNPTNPIIEYRMNVHLFGSISSPAVATFGLRMVANECASNHGEDVKEFIHHDFYVDDGLTSQPDSHTAVSLIERSRNALATKKLRFHKIASNSKEVMNALPEEARARDLKSLDLNHDVLPTQRSLGVYWCLERDTFTFQVDLQDKPFSRRGVLSIASSIYDPMGFVAPITIEGKVILRELLAEMRKEPNTPRDIWDRPLPEECLPRWTRWRNSLCHLEDIQVRRCYQPPDFGPVKKREIHIFSDASNLATGAVAYLRLVNEDDQPHVSFLLAKARLTPSHAVSIPRLELCAAVLATTLVQMVKSEIKDRVTIDSTTYYTDSKVVLGYISNESKRFHVYVANRVHKIQKVSTPSQWRHVSTDQNPADLASRSVPASKLSTTFWFRGPEFLWQRDISPTEVVKTYPSGQPPLDENDPDVRKQANISATSVASNPQDQGTTSDGQRLGCERFSRFSTWKSLRRAVALLIARVKSFKSKQGETTNPSRPCDQNQEVHSQITLDELQCAEKVILRAVQKESFGEEITSLKVVPNTDQAPQNVIKKKSPLYQLSPFLDEDGLIRVGGRLRRADLDLGGRHPVLLPKSSHVSKLFIHHFHQEIQHQGRHMTFAAVRSGGKWIIGAHDLVRSVINQCIICRKLRGKLLTQVMADLPEDRLQATAPFTNVGMDVFGPWTVLTRKTRGGSAEAKRWAVIFTCLCTRAVHVEVIEAMDTSAFISALRRFVSIRGPVARLRCDRGTNFIGAEGELNKEHIAEYLSTKNCEWIFNPPKASHFGGVWERQIQTVRRVLDSMFAQLGKHQLTHDILITFMAEACAIVNSRPITTIPSDANDPQALTPAMLLTLKTQPHEAPPRNFVKEDLYGRQRWRRVQYLADQFWIRWRKEYLQSLQPRQKWNQTTPDISEGDVVLLRQKELPRNNWPLARVMKTYPSDDGRVRKADVMVSTDGTRRTYLRPISELIFLEKAPTSN